MLIEGIITCVGFADFLSATLPHTRKLLDYLVVVTAPEDLETQRLCEFWNVHCCVTDAFKTGGSFNKGAGINAGLAVLKKTDWLLHLDADIFLPPLTRDLLERADLDPLCLYGADRFMIHSYEEWARFLRLPLLQQEDRTFVHTAAFPTGVRVSSPDYHGFVPIGFFQLWNVKSGVTIYPTAHGTAGRSDMIFTRNWPRSRRAFIPEFLGYHLESGPGDMGADWAGRKSPAFGPPPLPEALAELVPLPLTPPPIPY